MPSLYSFDVAVDLRVRIEDGKVRTTIPVAIVHLDTDSENQEIWVQLSTSDIDFIIKRLLRAQDDMKIAESLLSRRS